MNIFKEKEKRKGLIVTVIVHVTLLILFSLFGLNYMVPPPEEEGITINFGTSDAGMNDIQNETPAESNENAPTEQEVAEQEPVEQVEEEIITQNTEEAPSIDKKKEKPKEEVKPIEKPKEEPKPDKKMSEALNKWKTNKKEQGGGDGNSNQVGDQGALDGDKNSKNYEGGGSGDGTSFNLSGRSMLSHPKIQDNSQEEGRVVVDIIVDRYGKVLRATPGARGSNTTSSVLYKKATEAALKTKFNANPDAAEEQKGQMTFIFILN
ncbi:MAG: energy transducer TonB [Flavobacteriales bacterium]|nr:energy transducer TonB [Flavobacteriales bacterium]